MPGNAPNPAQIAQANMQARQMLLASAPRARKNVVTATAPLGGTLRLKLFNVGIISKLMLEVTAAVTIGTASATPSVKAPWNIISRVRLTDYDGTDRVNLSGFQLWVLNCVRSRTLYAFNNGGGSISAFTNPSVPTAVGAQTITFDVEIPLAYDVNNPVTQLQDLRGAILGQTAVGEMYLSIDFIGTLISNGDVDAVYTNSGSATCVATTTNLFTVTLWQDYFLPQALSNGQLVLPNVDLTTVYELNGNLKSSDNIAVNTEKLINYPNLRSVIGFYANYVTGGALAAGNVSKSRLIANGNNVLRDNSERLQYFEQRTFMIPDLDLPGGVYFQAHRNKPMETALFGNLQWGLTFSVVSGGNQYVEQATESFYTKGQALPGMVQASG